MEIVTNWYKETMQKGSKLCKDGINEGRVVALYFFQKNPLERVMISEEIGNILSVELPKHIESCESCRNYFKAVEILDKKMKNEGAKYDRT